MQALKSHLRLYKDCWTWHFCQFSLEKPDSGIPLFYPFTGALALVLFFVWMLMRIPDFNFWVSEGIPRALAAAFSWHGEGRRGELLEGRVLWKMQGQSLAFPCSSAPHLLVCLQSVLTWSRVWYPSECPLTGNPAGTCHHLWLDWASERFSALRLWMMCFHSKRTTRVDSVLTPDFECFDYKTETPLPIPCRAPLSPSLLAFSSPHCSLLYVSGINPSLPACVN